MECVTGKFLNSSDIRSRCFGMEDPRLGVTKAFLVNWDFSTFCKAVCQKHWIIFILNCLEDMQLRSWKWQLQFDMFSVLRDQKHIYEERYLHISWWNCNCRTIKICLNCPYHFGWNLSFRANSHPILRSQLTSISYPTGYLSQLCLYHNNVCRNIPLSHAH